MPDPTTPTPIPRKLGIDPPHRGEGKALRIFTASLATETNTFSPVPTDRASFEMAFYASPGNHPDTPTLCSSPMVVLRKLAKAENLDVIEGTATWAEPGGLLQRQTYEALRDEILDQLKAALPVDGVVLGLHGAMVAQGYDDCEGDLLARVREIVGRDVLIAAELDPHSHLTPKRVAAADILASFLEFPHTDFYERGEHVVDLALRTLRGEIRPAMSTFDCRMIAVLPTSREPMRSYVDRIKALHGKDGILSVSVIHGFMAADVPEMGTRIIVITDNDKPAGEALAKKLGMELFAMREQTIMAMVDTDEGIDQALAARRANPSKPGVIADTWDNPGGGVAGDGTNVLRRMIERGVSKVGVATIWDPLAVTFCHAAGEGAVIDLRFGGKAGPQGGEPIDARGARRQGRRGGLAEFRAFAGDARADGAGAHRGHGNRCHPEYQPHADLRTRHLFQSGRRPGVEGYPSDQIDQPLLCRLRADRGGDHLCRRADLLSKQSGQDALYQTEPRYLATRRQSACPLRLPDAN
jgi:microcystin degradation protein MlrC